MKTLYLVSMESFSGRTALCYGIAAQMKRAGLRVGYFKPLAFFGKTIEGHPHNEDAAFMRAALGLREAVETLAPITLDANGLEQVIAGQAHDYGAIIDQAFAQVSRAKDVVIIEGAMTLSEGLMLDLPPQKIVERCDARVIVAIKYMTNLAVDDVLAAQAQFGARFIGAVLNEIPRPQLAFVEQTLVPFLQSRGVRVYASLPQEPLLFSISVNEIAELLDAKILNSPERGEALVENLMVGAMSVDSALSYFRGKPNKAVITGGDRADLQLAALETSTRCLVLTGNLDPSPIIQGRAEELGVPLILAKQDTLSVVEIIQPYFGRLRLREPRKIARLEEIMNERFDFSSLYTELGIGL